MRPRAPFRFSEYTERPLTPSSDFSGWSKVSAPPTSARPLAGLRILDFTQFWAGPYATAWLAAMGAEVIKIENPNRPDALRMSGFVSPNDSRFLEAGPLFHLTNLNKKSVLIDLATEAGKTKAAELIKSCDVVAENFTPRVMDRFGFDWDTVHFLNPSAIYLRVPAFGLSGPLRDQPGFATTMEQLTGLASLTGFPGAEPVVPGGIIDPLTGIHAACLRLLQPWSVSREPSSRWPCWTWRRQSLPSTRPVLQSASGLADWGHSSVKMRNGSALMTRVIQWIRTSVPSGAASERLGLL